jgi:hypothetical protein
MAVRMPGSTRNKEKISATGSLAGDRPGSGQHPGAECAVELDHPAGYESFTCRRRDPELSGFGSGKMRLSPARFSRKIYGYRYSLEKSLSG